MQVIVSVLNVNATYGGTLIEVADEAQDGTSIVVANLQATSSSGGRSR